MNTNTARAQTPYQHFRQLTRYYGEPLYPGEHQLIAEAIEKFDHLSFDELVKLVDTNREKLTAPWELRRIWRLAKLPEGEREKHYRAYAAQRIASGRHDVSLLRSVLQRVGLNIDAGPMRLLDLGTGRGSFLAAAQSEATFRGCQFEGADMDMASLLINLKLNDEQGNGNYNLTCCYGERLPYEDRTFDIVASFQTLEHVGNRHRQSAFIGEACRCLAPGGVAVFTFPNRFDVLRPEPHVYIRFLGFVPQSMKDRVSLALRGVPSSDIFPPDAITLMRGLKTVKGVEFRLYSNSEFSPSGWKRMIARSIAFKVLGPWNVLVGRRQF